MWKRIRPLRAGHELVSPTVPERHGPVEQRALWRILCVNEAPTSWDTGPPAAARAAPGGGVVERARLRRTRKDGHVDGHRDTGSRRGARVLLRGDQRQAPGCALASPPP